MYSKLIRTVLMLCVLSIIGKVNAFPPLITTDLSNGYSACSWIDNGNGTSTINLKISYKPTLGYIANSFFYSRSILVYPYDQYGQFDISSNAVESVWMNGDKNSKKFVNDRWNLVTYYSTRGAWMTERAFVADVEVLIKNSEVAAWPAIAVRAANSTHYGKVMEISGAAYIARDGRNGNCMVVKAPETSAPPLPIQFKVSAPDWNLGELPQGDATKTFTNSAEQLCFTYTGKAVGGKLFVINAGSANGVSGNRYRLKHVEDPTQTVPYKVTLDSGTAKLSLPNGSNTALALNSSGKTCFAPTFETSVGGRVKDGDYVDTLTFTVVTKT
ncbi:hypothetical protein [Burkholderia ubonensis]|uniref:hypothetical protein n=1 Tax=Burkholderia ubonensis TaxID=101571 RepID=UPI000AABBEC8|nr:hypothetical protein [Burkholderia ubonensis]